MGRIDWNDPKPWMPQKAVDFLRREVLRSHYVGLELGSGGSTPWIAQQIKRLYSVEHNEKWAERVEIAIKDLHLGNVTLLIGRPTSLLTCVDAFISEKDGLDYTPVYGYAKEFLIEQGVQELDFVIVDGRARLSCVISFHPWVKWGGWLVLDDAHRERYAPAEKCLLDAGFVKTRIGNKRRATDFYKCKRGKE